MDANCRLVAYGTLAPDRPNHHQLDGLEGRWFSGSVRGTFVEAGWGAALGYPALVLSPASPTVEALIFESSDLPSHWARLDEFEGSSYQRVVTTVEAAEGPMEASIYVLKP